MAAIDQPRTTTVETPAPGMFDIHVVDADGIINSVLTVDPDDLESWLSGKLAADVRRASPYCKG